jgi:Membrane bound O-acyl transferase family
LAFSIFSGLKWVTWWRARTQVPHPHWRAAAYLLAWPGMDAASFLDETEHPDSPHFADWFSALFKTAIGASLLWLVARTVPPAQLLLRGWIGMLGLIFLLHFGVFHLLGLFWQSHGVQAEPVMRAPLRARSLSEFWGKRWNLGFRQLGHDLIFVPLHKHLAGGFASLVVFLVSGLIHDLVISVPARAGFGLPTAYFTLQGLGVLVERSSFGRQIGFGKGLRGFLFLGLIAAGPIFWLFHPAFVLRVIIPFMQAVRAL